MQPFFPDVGLAVHLPTEDQSQKMYSSGSCYIKHSEIKFIEECVYRLIES